MKKIAFPNQPGIGGPGSFQKRFERELLKEKYYYQRIARGHDVHMFNNVPICL